MPDDGLLDRFTLYVARDGAGRVFTSPHYPLIEARGDTFENAFKALQAALAKLGQPKKEPK